MPTPNEEAFLRVWPRCFVIFLGIIELFAAIVLLITELGNVAADFWITNVFAGGWCGLIMIIHFFGLFVAGCCKPGPPAAFRSLVITIIALLACAVLISFDAVFIALPSTCVLTPSCATNVGLNTTFSYNIQTGFNTIWNNLGPFKAYTELQTKFFFQTIQLGVGCLCFVLCIIYLIIYYVTKSKAAKQVSPASQQPRPQQQNYPQQNYPQQNYPQQGYPQQSYPQQNYPQQAAYAPQPPQQQYRQPRAPQAAPGELPWNAQRRY